jgi:hypothetical protein
MSECGFRKSDESLWEECGVSTTGRDRTLIFAVNHTTTPPSLNLQGVES